jgi:ureidoglycolate lyase
MTGRMTGRIDYMTPHIRVGLDVVDVPLVKATMENLGGYGALVNHPDDHEVEIVQWPRQGWRAIDDGTGDEGGTVEGS